jgi:hypothetical protein
VTGHTTFCALRACTLVGIALAIVTVGLSVWRDRGTAITEGNREIRNVGAFVGGHISRALQAFDIMLRDVQRQAETEINRTDVDGEAVIGTQGFYRPLNNYVVSLPHALHIIVTDRHGDALAASSGWPAPHLNFADRSYFIELAAANDDRLIVAEPVQNRITGQTAINFARRLRGTDGSFRGVALVSFASAYLEAIFSSVDVRSSQAFALVRRDGTVLVSYPEGFAEPGETVGTLPRFLAAVAAGGGSYQTHGTVGGPMRWTATHLLADYPLVVLTSVPEDVLLADWRVSAVLATTQFLVLLAVAICLLYIIAHQFRQLSVSEASLKATSLKLDAAFSNMSQGVAMFDANALLIVSNEHFRHMLSAPPSLPLNSEFRLPIAIGRIERSTVLLSTSMRPSLRNSLSPSQ